MTDLIPTPSPGFVADTIQRMRSDLLHLETLCSGHYIAGPVAVADIKDMVCRLESLCLPTKGYLTGGVKAREMKDAA